NGQTLPHGLGSVTHAESKRLQTEPRPSGSAFRGNLPKPATPRSCSATAQLRYNGSPGAAMKTLILATVLFLPAALSAAGKDGWISMFDGKTLNGWKANQNPESWTVRDGAITGDGEASHLFWMVQECADCE